MKAAQPPRSLAGVVHAVQDGLFSAALCRAEKKPDVGYNQQINRKAQQPQTPEQQCKNPSRQPLCRCCLRSGVPAYFVQPSVARRKSLTVRVLFLRA